jgi:hypothetical protein
MSRRRAGARPLRALRVAALCGLFAAGLPCLAGGCTELESDLVRWHRGRADHLALGTLDRAARITLAARDIPPPRCRNRLPDGPLTVETRVELSLKVGGYARERRWERQVWRRDEHGAIAVAHELHQRLPDGRPVVRTRETRVIEGRAWRALDGFFVEGDRIPDVVRETERAWSAPVDSILGLVQVQRGGLRAGRAGEAPICPRTDDASMPDPSAGRVERSMHGRSGWLRWHEWGGPALTVVWTESIRSGTAPIEPPDEVWSVEPDRSWEEVGRFVDELVAAGLIEGAAPLEGSAEDATAHADRRPSAGSGSD